MTDAIFGALLVEARRHTELLMLLALPQAQVLARTALEGEKERAVYTLTDGRHSSRQIESETNVPKSTVTRWWSRWRSLGLVAEEDGGMRCVFALDQLDLPALAPSVEKRNGN